MRAKIEKVLDEIRPILLADGADVEFVQVTEDGVVQVRLHGVCGDCSNFMMTLSRGIERMIMEQVPEVRAVVAV